MGLGTGEKKYLGSALNSATCWPRTLQQSHSPKLPTIPIYKMGVSSSHSCGLNELKYKRNVRAGLLLEIFLLGV